MSIIIAAPPPARFVRDRLISIFPVHKFYAFIPPPPPPSPSTRRVYRKQFIRTDSRARAPLRSIIIVLLYYYFVIISYWQSPKPVSGRVPLGISSEHNYYYYYYYESVKFLLPYHTISHLGFKFKFSHPVLLLFILMFYYSFILLSYLFLLFVFILNVIYRHAGNCIVCIIRNNI